MSADDEGPLYYVEGMVVRKRPIKRRMPNGSTNITLGFPVCTVSEWVGKEGAIAVAEMLTLAGTGQLNPSKGEGE